MSRLSYREVVELARGFDRLNLWGAVSDEQGDKKVEVEILSTFKNNHQLTGFDLPRRVKLLAHSTSLRDLGEPFASQQSNRSQWRLRLTTTGSWTIRLMSSMSEQSIRIHGILLLKRHSVSQDRPLDMRYGT